MTIYPIYWQYVPKRKQLHVRSKHLTTIIINSPPDELKHVSAVLKGKFCYFCEVGDIAWSIKIKELYILPKSIKLDMFNGAGSGDIKKNIEIYLEKNGHTLAPVSDTPPVVYDMSYLNMYNEINIGQVGRAITRFSIDYYKTITLDNKQILVGFIKYMQ